MANNKKTTKIFACVSKKNRSYYVMMIHSVLCRQMKGVKKKVMQKNTFFRISLLYSLNFEHKILRFIHNSLKCTAEFMIIVRTAKCSYQNILHWVDNHDASPHINAIKF